MDSTIPRREFCTQPHLAKLHRAVLPTSVLVMLAFWVVLLFLGRACVHVRPALIRLCLLLDVTTALAAYLCHLILTDLQRTRFVLSRDKLVVVSARRTKALSLGDVQEVGYRGLPLGHGHGYLRATSGRLVLPFVIQDIHSLVAGLRENLARIGKESISSGESARRLQCAATIADLRAARASHALGPVTGYALMLAALSLLTARWIWMLPVPISVAWSLCGAIFPLLGFLVADLILSVRSAFLLERDPKTLPDLPVTTTYARVAVTTTCVYLACGILFRSIGQTCF